MAIGILIFGIIPIEIPGIGDKFRQPELAPIMNKTPPSDTSFPTFKKHVPFMSENIF